jgi:hypothetical protein
MLKFFRSVILRGRLQKKLGSGLFASAEPFFYRVKWLIRLPVAVRAL